MQTEPHPEPPAGLRIRPAVAADAGLVLALVRELAEYERLAAQVVAGEDDFARWLFGDAPAAEVAIAEVDGAAVGFALFFTSFSTFLGRPGIYLEDLYVRSAHRGRGVGGALLRHLAQETRARGYGRLEWSVLDWNRDAIGFYLRLGAVAMTEWSVYRLAGDALAACAGEPVGR